MTLPKSLTTVTTFSKLLALWLYIFLPFAGFYLGMKYQEKQNLLLKTTIEKEKQNLQLKLDEYTNPYGIVVSEQKNIQFPKVGYRTSDIFINFPNREKTTYNKTVIRHKGNTYTIFSLNLPEELHIYNAIQPVSKTADYLHSIYEGVEYKPVQKLKDELSQPPGFYPAISDTPSYIVSKNNNGITLKKTYAAVPGYIQYQVEFFDNYSINRHYLFSTSTPYTHAVTAISPTENLITWRQNNPHKEFDTLDNFVNQIKLLNTNP